MAPLLARGNCTHHHPDERFLRLYLLAMAVLAWITVLTGTYKIYLILST